jgi:quinol monooxygenase YgiN
MLVYASIEGCSKMIHVVAILTAKPGQRDAVLAEFKKNIPLVKAEPGCIQYTPVIDIEDGPATSARLGSDAFMVIEQWESQDALRAHAASAHMAAYAERVKELLQSRVVYALNSIG